MKMNNQKNANIMIKAAGLSAIILIFLCFIVIFYVAFSGDNTSEIQENGERYGTSDFYKYKDKIYVLVIGSGMLEVEGVDIPTFKVFEEDNNGNVAYDKNRVYFGNIAVSDFLTRNFYKEIQKNGNDSSGTGGSGRIFIDKCGQEILERTSVLIKEDKIEVRFEMGMPARGRRIMGKAAQKIIFEQLPKIVEKSIIYDNLNKESLKEQIILVLDQEYIRKVLEEKEKEIEEKFKDKGYGEFKKYVAEIVGNFLENIQGKYNKILNSNMLDEILDKGKAKTRLLAKEKYEQVKEKVGVTRKNIKEM